MHVFLQKENKTVIVDHTGTAASLLLKLGISSQVVLIVKDGCLITENDVVDDAKRIDLLSVISGG